MKILAGEKLNSRNASAAEAIEMDATASHPGPAMQATNAYVPKPNTAMPPAIPSDPSMKLNALTIHAMAKNNSSRANVSA